MESKPFFSILLPTKNRAHIIAYAIQSILNQSFVDFEIILVDNDDGDDTGKVVENFQDPRLKYFRTGSLNMVENWSYALSKARGRFVTVLEDKQAYYPSALETILQAITEKSSSVIVWGWDIFNDNLKLAYQTSTAVGMQNIFSNDVLWAYVNNSPAAWQYLPRMLNSCISMELIQRINQHPNIDNFFSLLSPDLCAAFYQLGYTEELCIIHQSLGLSGYLQLSNANQSLETKKEITDFFGKGDFSAVSVNLVPIKEGRLIHNSVYNDYLRVRKKIGGRLDGHKMSPNVYAKLCVSDFARMPYENNSEILKEILGYVRKHRVSRMPLLMLYIKTTVVRKLSKMKLLSNMRDRLKKQTWKADNILDATIKKKSNDTRN